MRHRVKKIKFRAGTDANKMLVKKLIYNFLLVGKISSTLKKVKVLKSLVEKAVEKAKEKNEANKNYLLRYVTDKKTMNLLFETIGPTLKDKTGGYVRVVKLGVRNSDGSEMARLEWAYPIVIETPKEKSPKSQIPKTKQITNPKSKITKR